MAHKTLVDGTAYEIKGGKALVDGTVYSIKNGKTLVGGTVYEIGFVKMATITLDFTDAGIAGLLAAEVNGTLYQGGFGGVHYGKVYEISVPVGEKIACKISSSDIYTSNIVVNGTTVLSTNDAATYEYLVIGNATIKFDNLTLTITET